MSHDLDVSALTSRCLTSIVALAGTLILASCSERSPDACWSTKVLRVAAGGTVLDVPGWTNPFPFGRFKDGDLLQPRYPKEQYPLKELLVNCQSRAAVPLAVTGFDLRAPIRGQSSSGTTYPEVIRVSLTDGTAPQYRMAQPIDLGAQWAYKQTQPLKPSSTISTYRVAGRDIRLVRCFDMKGVPPIGIASCQAEIKLNTDLWMSILFRRDAHDPSRDAALIKSMSREILSWRVHRRG